MHTPRRRPAARVVTALALCLAALAGCTQASDDGGAPAETGTSPTGAAVDIVASELQAPWSVVAIDDSLLVSERDSGTVLEVTGAGSVREVGVVTDAAGQGEGGLLGLALDGDQRLYAYLTTTSDNRIQRFLLAGEPGSLRLGEPETILDGLPAAGNHNGGRIAFGPDGMLYAGTGDAGDRESAQDLESLGGKILRMTPDGGVPADNPFPGSLVYSYGHRNVQGLAWAADGTMFASEFGQDTWDELNVIEPGGNYGWPLVEGQAGDGEHTDPVQQWEPGEASPSGITILDEIVYIANLRGERLRAVPVADPDTFEDLLVGEYGRLRDVLPAPGGGLLVVTNNTDGRGDPGEDDDRILHLSLDE